MAAAHWEVGDRVTQVIGVSPSRTGTVVRQAQMGKPGKYTNAVAIRWDGDTDPTMLGYSCILNSHLCMAAD